MSIIVRCDADQASGLGHAARALALAEVLAEREGGPIRVVARPTRLLDSFLAGGGVELLPLVGTGYGLGPVLAEAVRGDVLVSDTYDLDEEALEATAAAGLRHVVIDDFGRLERWNCDVLVNPNLGVDEAAYRGPARVLTGPRYALLRREIRAAAAAAGPRTGRRALICLGGGTWPAAAEALLEAVASLGIDARATTASPVPDGIEAVPPSTLARQLAGSDVGLLSAGVVKYEAAACGLPAVLTAVVGHQEPLAASFAQTGAAWVAPPLRDVTAPAIARRLLELLDDSAARAQLAERARSLVDGEGVARVAAALAQGRD